MKRNNGFRSDPPSIARGIGPRKDLAKARVPTLQDFGVMLCLPDEAFCKRAQAEQIQDELDQPKTNRRQDRED